jgi:hypothetical protein
LGFKTSLLLDLGFSPNEILRRELEKKPSEKMEKKRETERPKKSGTRHGGSKTELSGG